MQSWVETIRIDFTLRMQGTTILLMARQWGFAMTLVHTICSRDIRMSINMFLLISHSTAVRDVRLFRAHCVAYDAKIRVGAVRCVRPHMSALLLRIVLARWTQNLCVGADRRVRPRRFVTN